MSVRGGGGLVHPGGEQWRAPCLERNGWLSIGAAEEGGTERKTRAVKMSGAEARRGRSADGGAAG